MRIEPCILENSTAVNGNSVIMDSSLSARLTQISQSHAGTLLRNKRLGSVGKQTDDTPTHGRSASESAADATSPLLQRVAIIQKDEKGYGLTVSGDNPVYVASVKAGGAAEKAGVQTGDRIIKVNGKQVTSSNHTEVVKLIKSGSYVALTLLGKPSQPTRESTVFEGGDTNRDSYRDTVSGPHPVDAEKEREVQQQKARTIRAMYDAGHEEYDKLRKLYKSSPSDKLLTQVQEKEKTLKILEAQVKNLPGLEHLGSNRDLVSTPSINVDSDPMTTEPSSGPSWPMRKERKTHMKHSSSPGAVCRPAEAQSKPSTNVSRSKSDVSSRKNAHSEYMFTAPAYKRTESSPERTESLRRKFSMPKMTLRKNASLPATVSDLGSDSPCTSPSTSPTPLNIHNIEPGDSGIEDGSQNSYSMMRPNSLIIGAEDDEFQSEDESTGENKIFTDLHVLEKKPAHMAIFLHYVLTHHNPASILFYQLAGLYSNSPGNFKDLKKWAYEIHSTFIISMAPLKVNGISDIMIHEIDSNLSYRSEREEILRAIFEKARTACLDEVHKLLEDVRIKKEQGLIEGSGELKDHMDKNEEQKIVEKYLLPHLEKSASSGEEDEKQVAQSWALATFLRHICHNKTSHSNVLERVPSFVTKDKQRASRLVGFSRDKKSKSVKGHQFSLTHLHKAEFCLHCSKLLWGVGPQGYQCSTCDNCVHKRCIESLHEACIKKKNRSSTASKKPTIPGSSIKSALTDLIAAAATPIVNDLDNSPTQTNHPQISPQPLKGQEDVEMGAFTAQGHSVNNMVMRFENTSPDRESPGRYIKHRTVASSVPDFNIRQVRRTSTSSTHSTLSLPAGVVAPRRKGSDLGRSESMKGRADQRGDKPTRRSASDLMMDDNTMKIVTSASSSNSSLRSTESPSTSMDTFTIQIEDDSDFDVEADLPTLKQVLGEDTVRKLKPKEKKRQDVINELFYTEKSHVRNLKILDKLFYRPMLKDTSIPQEFTKSLFPNLETMVQLHGSLNKCMKERRSEKAVISTVGDILLKRLDGEPGENFRNGCAIFCRNQSHTLEQLRMRIRKEPKTAQLLSDAENNPLCRRLALKDIIPKQFMRLTKYPLLIENLLKYTPTNTEEYSNLEQSLKCSKHILEYVNQAVKECENYQRLIDLQRKIDKKSIDNSAEADDLRTLDLTKHKLIHDGSLTWIINNKKQIDVHLVLLERAMVLLQKQEDRLVLKLQSTQLVAGRTDAKRHSPLLWLNNVLARNDATDKKAFFVVNTSKAGPQIYKLLAGSADEQKTWTKYITQSAETMKRNEINLKNKAPVQEPVPAHTQQQVRANHVELADMDNGTLVHPEDVQYSDPVITTAVQVITPLEKLRQNDENLAAVLEERQGLIAELLNVNPSDVCGKVQDVIEGEGDDPQELIAACQQQTSQIIDMMKESPPPTSDSGEKYESVEDLTLPIPMERLREMANRMNQILTNLLAQTRATATPMTQMSQAAVNSRYEERDRLRRELKFAQEELNRLRKIQQMQLEAEKNKTDDSKSETEKTARPASLVSDMSTASESETEEVKTESEQESVTEDNMPGLPIEPDEISQTETLNETSPGALDSLVDTETALSFGQQIDGIGEQISELAEDGRPTKYGDDGIKYEEAEIQHLDEELHEIEPPEEDQIEDLDTPTVEVIGPDTEEEDDDDGGNAEQTGEAGDASEGVNKGGISDPDDAEGTSVDPAEDNTVHPIDNDNIEMTESDKCANTSTEDVMDRLKVDEHAGGNESDTPSDISGHRSSGEYHDAIETNDSEQQQQTKLTEDPGGTVEGSQVTESKTANIVTDIDNEATQPDTAEQGSCETEKPTQDNEGNTVADVSDSLGKDIKGGLKSNNNVDKESETVQNDGDDKTLSDSSVKSLNDASSEQV